MADLESFLRLAEKTAFDAERRQKIDAALANYRVQHNKGIAQFEQLELAKERASFSRWRAIESLDKFLLEFENAFTKRGGKVLWAPDAVAALSEIENIVTQHAARELVISKSTTAQEIGLQKHFTQKQVAVHETDLGEYIVQLANEAPFHPVTPAMHKSLEEVGALFNLPNSHETTAEQLTAKGCGNIKTHLRNAQVSITGANFLVAETGAVVITENEGNVRVGTSAPAVHIVLAGIEKIIPGMGDLEVLLPLLATYGTGQNLTTYNSLFMGPRFQDEADGPAEMYVILLDNGRTNVLEKQEQRAALKCIRCGACSNVCPVFKTIGGHGYESTNIGPIGSVVSPLQFGAKEFKHLSHASTLCGACTDVCPVNIPIHQALLANRKDFVDEGHGKTSEKLMWIAWKKAMLDRKKMNRAPSIKGFLIKSLFKSSWGERRVFPEISSKSFNELWREQHDKK